MGVVRVVDGAEAEAGAVAVAGARVGALSGMTQTDLVLEFLRDVGPLTQPVAQEELGCLRLGARIWDLKQRGFSISTELVELPSGQRVAEYSLGGASTLLPGRESKAPLPGKGGESAGSSGGAGVGLRDGVTLDVALGVFGDLVMELGVSPTVREFGARLGVSSESVAHRWVRVLEGEGLLAVNAQLEVGSTGTQGGRRLAARGWVVSAAGFERLYRVERGRRLVLERVA